MEISNLTFAVDQLQKTENERENINLKNCRKYRNEQNNKRNRRTKDKK